MNDERKDEENTAFDTVRPMKGRIGVKGTLVFKDKDGNVVGTTDISGSVAAPTKE